MKLSKIGFEKINHLRDKLDKDGHKAKQLIISVDGSYTTETVLKNIKGNNSTIIGRIRKDAKLNEIPKANQIGRKRIYSKELSNPEQIRQFDEYPWQEVQAWACKKKTYLQCQNIKKYKMEEVWK